MNREHYKDPTADRAIQKILREQWRLNTVIKIIKLVCQLGGFKLLKRVELQDAGETHDEYRK